jgi:hypothetical protein
MSALKDKRGGVRPAPQTPEIDRTLVQPKPNGPLDPKALVDEVARVYPKIIARLAE